MILPPIIPRFQPLAPSPPSRPPSRLADLADLAAGSAQLVAILNPLIHNSKRDN